MTSLSRSIVLHIATLSLLLFATGFSLAESYDFMGMTNAGDSIVLAGSFSASDVDNDGTFEFPNQLFEVTNFNAQATLYNGNGGSISVPWSLFDIQNFAFEPVQDFGLMSMQALNVTNDLVNGNEVHNNSTLSMSNQGNIAS